MANVEKLVGTESPLEVGQKINEIIEKGVGGGNSLFDTKLSDHILEGEEAQGWALQGTYVYKDAVAGSREGYPDFYAKCLEEYQNSVNTKAYLKSNITKVGSVVDDQGVLSGFSTANYATLPSVFAPTANDTWEVVLKFTLNATGVIQTIWGCTSQFDGAFIGVSATNKISCYISSNGTSWNIANAVAGTTTLTVGVDYTVKFTFDGSQYKVAIKTNTTDFVDEITVSSTSVVYANAVAIGAGISSNSDSNVFKGSINLNDCHININGERWWSGVDNLEYKQNSNGHQFYDIADKSFADAHFEIYGSAWLYGVDIKNERIFLPRNNWYEQLTMDNADVGKSVGAGLPNIEGEFGGAELQFTPASGAFYQISTEKGAGQDGTDYKVGFDASLSNSIYGNSDTVQTNAVKKLLYICVGNTTSTSAVTDVVEVTTTENDTLPLLHHIPADELLENPSWLRSAGQWNDGKVYTTAYEYLVNEYVNGQAHTDTLTTPDGTEYTVNYKTIKGKKVVDVANEGQVNAVYNVIGSAWYYIIDQENIQFKLPQSHNSECYTSDPTRVGLDVSAGLPNIEGEFWTGGGAGLQGGEGAFSKGAKKSTTVNTNTASNNSSIIFDASLSNPIYGNSDTVTAPHTEFYLYFKVANAVQNLELLDAGEVLEAVADKISRQDCKAYVTETYQNDTSWYRVYSDGWCEQGGIASYVVSSLTVALLKAYANTNYSVFLTTWDVNDTGGAGNLNVLASKTTDSFVISMTTDSDGGVIWEAKGYIS